jgi:membrane protein implicated in regulation of membrane protease activity
MVTMTQIWFIAAAVLLLAELLVTTFFMLPFAIGSFFAGLVSLISDSQNIQLGTFVVFSIVGVYISIKIFGPKKNKLSESKNFNEGTNKYIGKSFVSTAELDPYTSISQHVFGDDWQVVSITQRIPSNTVVEVKNVSGTKLEVQTKEG